MKAVFPLREHLQKQIQFGRRFDSERRMINTHLQALQRSQRHTFRATQFPGHTGLGRVNHPVRLFIGAACGLLAQGRLTKRLKLYRSRNHGQPESVAI